jgi:RND family efflux transporter MFP subunit
MMKRPIIVLVLVAAIGGAGYYMLRGDGAGAADTGTGGAAGRQGGAPGGGGFGGFGGPGGNQRPPMTVELASVKRADMSQEIMVVGNLIGQATVEATPKVNGRLESVSVRMGDRVARGQRLAKIEDDELLEQIKQAEASFAVAAATIRQREADLGLSRTNLERSRNLFERQLIPKQTFDDAEARYQAAQAQLDLAKAQYQQSQARIDELKINLANTTITSPVTGFIGKRTLDPGAWVGPNSVFLSVVDISVVRMVANVVEKDLRRMSQGLPTRVEVDAFPGETFAGRVAHVAPVLDPATRTAQVEIEVPNSDFRLKPGMYARVNFKVEQHDNTLVVPASAVVDYGGKRGVFMANKGERGNTATFKPIAVGIVDQTHAEVESGLDEGENVVTTGAGALREGDRIVLAGDDEGQGGVAAPEEGGAARGAGAARRGGQGQGQAPPGGGQGGTREGGDGNGQRGGGQGGGRVGGEGGGQRGPGGNRS